MSYLEDSLDWQAIGDIDAWLDAEVAQDYKDMPLAQDWARIGKVAEELGEAIQAFIGYTGQNPRKGFTHSQDDVLRELSDVVLTGILAMQHITKDTWEVRDILKSTLAKIEARVPRLDGDPA